MLGYRSETELIGKSYRELVHPDEVEEVSVLVDQLVSGARPGFQREIRYRRRDSSTVWTLTGVALIRDSHERPWYFAAQLQDLTTIREQEELGRAAAAIENHHRLAHTIRSEILQDLRTAREELDEGHVAGAQVALGGVVAATERLLGQLLAEPPPPTKPMGSQRRR
jgi:PAS domain S-box-containing protein